jgi:hypothetical protein
MCWRRQQRIVARHDAAAKVITTRLRTTGGDGCRRTASAYCGALPGARVDQKVEVTARKWLLDVAIVRPSGGQAVHARPSRSVCGEAVKRKKYKGAVPKGRCRGLWWRQEGGWVLRPRSSSTRWWRSAKCQMARKAAASKMKRAAGIEVMHKQAHMHDGHFGSKS